MTVTEEIITMQERGGGKPDKPAKLKKKKRRKTVAFL